MPVPATMNLLRFARDTYRHRRTVAALLNNHQTFTKHREATLWGCMSQQKTDELVRLVEQARQHEGPIIEIGTLFGITAQAIASAKRPEQRLITVDNYSWNPFCMPADDHREFTRRALDYCVRHAGVEIFDGTSEDFFAGYAGPAPALVFLDGSHRYEHVSAELRHARRLGARILCGDDYCPVPFPGLVRAIAEEVGPDIHVTHDVWSWTAPSA